MTIRRKKISQVTYCFIIIIEMKLPLFSPNQLVKTSFVFLLCDVYQGEEHDFGSTCDKEMIFITDVKSNCKIFVHSCRRTVAEHFTSIRNNPLNDDMFALKILCRSQKQIQLEKLMRKVLKPLLQQMTFFEKIFCRAFTRTLYRAITCGLHLPPNICPTFRMCEMENISIASEL